MRPAISLITAAAFWLHLLMGCCAHHLHAAEEGVCGAGHSAAEVHEGAEHCHSHVVTPEAPEEPVGCHDDGHEGHRSLQVSGKMTLDLDVPEAALFVLDASMLGRQCQSTSIAWFDDPAGHFTPPVRLHLLNQIILI